MDIDRIGDELEIAALLHTYARAVDTKDWRLYRSVFTDDAYIDYSSAGAAAGPRDEVTEWLSNAFDALPMSMHYIGNIETDIDGDHARVRAMFYNPMRLPGMSELSWCGGYYHHDLLRTPQGWRSRNLREENVWFVNAPEADSPADRRRNHDQKPGTRRAPPGPPRSPGPPYELEDPPS